MQNLQALQNTSRLGTRQGVKNSTTYYSLLYDGINDRSQIADASNYEGLAIGTIECFIKTSYTGGSYQKLFRKTTAYDIGISANFGSGNIFFGNIEGVKDFGQIGTGRGTGVWTHVAASWNASTIEVYIAGTRGYSAAVDGAQTSSSAAMFVGHAGGSEFMNGNMAYIRISNVKRYTGTTLTVPTAPYTNDANTMVRILMTEGSGSTAADSSGNGNNLALDGTNPPAWSTDVPF